MIWFIWTIWLINIHIRATEGDRYDCIAGPVGLLWLMIWLVLSAYCDWYWYWYSSSLTCRRWLIFLVLSRWLMTACKCSRRLILWIEWIRVSDNWGMISRMIYPNSIGATDRYIIRQYQEAWLEIGQCFSDSRFYLLLRFHWCFICWPVAIFSSNFGSSLLCFIRREPGGSYGDGLANFGFDFFSSYSFDTFIHRFSVSVFSLCLFGCGNEKCCSRLSRGECYGAARFYSIIFLASYFWSRIFLQK